MRYIYITLLSLLTFGSAYASGVEKDRAWGIIGIKSDRLLGEGVENNTFKNGYGIFLEFGFDDPSSPPGLAIGTGFYKTSNHVGIDRINAGFYTPIYFELRHYRKTFFNICHYYAYGLTWNRMYLEDLKGGESQLLLSFGIVEQYLFGSNKIIQLSIKPYFVYPNNLGQRFGLLINLAYGWAE